MTDAKAHKASALSISAVWSCQHAIKELQWNCLWRDFVLATPCDSPSSNYLLPRSPVSQVIYASAYCCICDFTA